MPTRDLSNLGRRTTRHQWHHLQGRPDKNRGRGRTRVFLIVNAKEMNWTDMGKRSLKIGSAS